MVGLDVAMELRRGVGRESSLLDRTVREVFMYLHPFCYSDFVLASLRIQRTDNTTLAQEHGHLHLSHSRCVVLQLRAVLHARDQGHY